MLRGRLWYGSTFFVFDLFYCGRVSFLWGVFIEVIVFGFSGVVLRFFVWSFFQCLVVDGVVFESFIFLNGEVVDQIFLVIIFIWSSFFFSRFQDLLSRFDERQIMVLSDLFYFQLNFDILSCLLMVYGDDQWQKYRLYLQSCFGRECFFEFFKLNYIDNLVVYYEKF